VGDRDELPRVALEPNGPHQVRADAVSAAVHARRRGGPRAWARLHAADAERADG